MMAFFRTVKYESQGVSIASIASDFGELSRAVASFAQETLHRDPLLLDAMGAPQDSRPASDASRTTSEK